MRLPHLAIVVCACFHGASATASAAALPAVPLTAADQLRQASDIAWMLVATGLVVLMVPGLALFYGGMVRRKNVLGTMMHSMAALAIVGLQWVLLGYALAFGASNGGWIGWSPEFLGLSDPTLWDQVFPGTRLPIFVHALFHGMLAAITPALISGAFAERIRFGPYCLFLVLWSTVVYAPLAHWMWAVGADGRAAGWLGRIGALDFAGGMVVHLSAGLAGLAAVLVLRKRSGYPERAMHPHGMVLTLTGTGLLWFGWLGFNGGSALAANRLAAAAVTATQVAASAGGIGWLTAEWLHRGKPTGLGLASGIIAGLVAVTPAAGYVTPAGALAIGLMAGVVCYAAVCVKPRFKYDDSLDVFGVHGVGGFLGAVLTGAFAVERLWQAGTGRPDGLGTLAVGTFTQVGVQLLAAVAIAAYAFVATAGIIKMIDVTIGFCLPTNTEELGLDRGVHGEVGLDLGTLDEAVAEAAYAEPRAASIPPEGHRRFTVVVEGVANRELMDSWSDLCQPGSGPPSPEFRAVYPYVTTVQGNRFQFRGGDASLLRECLGKLFEDRLEGTAVRTHVEN